MTYLPDLHTRRQVPTDGEALTVRAVPASAISAFGTLVSNTETITVELQFPYGLLHEHLNTSASNGGWLGSTGGHAIVNAGAVANGYAAIESKSSNRYIAGIGARFKFAGYFVSGGLASSTQEVGIGDVSDGYFFGYSGSQFGVLRRTDGVDTWTAQSSWSIDPMDGTGPSGQTLDPTKGNVYQISYQWLGYGAITYVVEDSTTGMLFPVHRTSYANAYNSTSVRDPNLPVRMAVRSWGSTGAPAINVSSICGMVEGNVPVHGIRRSSDDSISGVSAEVPVISLMNSSSFGGRTNRMRIKVDLLSAANRDSANPVSYRLIANANLTNASWTAISGSNSPVSVDKAATAFSGGRQIAFIGLGPNGSQVLDLSRLEVRLAPGETITVTASGSNSTCLAGLGWLEEL